MALSVALPLLMAVLCWPPRRPAPAGQHGIGGLWSDADVDFDTVAGTDTARSAAGAGHETRSVAAVETTLSVATAIDLLALALTSGAPLTNSLTAVAEHSGPVVAAQLRQVTAALQWGVDETKAWRGLPSVWRPAADALTLAARVGMPAAGLLREAAATIRRDERQALQERTARLGVLIVLPLGGCFLPAFAVLTVLPVVAVIARSVLAGT